MITLYIGSYKAFGWVGASPLGRVSVISHKAAGTLVYLEYRVDVFLCCKANFHSNLRKNNIKKIIARSDFFVNIVLDFSTV